LIATTVGSDGVTIAGFGLILASAACWASGNVILRGTSGVEMFAVIVWISALACGPLLALSLAFEGPTADLAALAQPTTAGVIAVAFVAIPTTILGFWVWGELLKRYPAALVAPFALLVPVTGTLSAWALFGERFGTVRLAGMALIMLGLAVNALPWERLRLNPPPVNARRIRPRS
jgi:O-acetylserine/cysteine efflux transporter